MCVYRLEIKNAIYLDIGAGIDALAGLIDPDRPYASSWINYQMKKILHLTIQLYLVNWKL